jgi:hypothetical protein
MNVPTFLYVGSTKVTGNQVILLLYILFILYIRHILHSLVWCVPVHHRILAQCISTSLVCHSSVLHTGVAASYSSGHKTGTIPYVMRRESCDFPGASCDKSKDCKTDVAGGVWTAGPWDGEQSKTETRKQIQTIYHMQICKICKIHNMQNISMNMQNMQNMQMNIPENMQINM